MRGLLFSLRMIVDSVAISFLLAKATGHIQEHRIDRLFFVVTFAFVYIVLSIADVLCERGKVCALYHKIELLIVVFGIAGLSSMLQGSLLAKAVIGLGIVWGYFAIWLWREQ